GWGSVAGVRLGGQRSVVVQDDAELALGRYLPQVEVFPRVLVRRIDTDARAFRRVEGLAADRQPDRAGGFGPPLRPRLGPEAHPRIGRLHRVGHHLELPPARVVALDELGVTRAGDGGEVIPGGVIPRDQPGVQAPQQLLVHAEGDGGDVLWPDVRGTQ